MKINVKKLSGEQFFVNIDALDSVSKLKSKIEDASNTPVLQQRLIYSGRELIDNATINQYNIEEGKTVHLVMRRNVGPAMYGTTVGTSAPTTTTSSVPVSGGPIDIESQQAISPNSNNNSNENDESTPLNGDNNVNNGNYTDDLAQGGDGARLLEVMELARACRLIRLFSIIDCVLMILFAFWGDLLFLAGVPLAICGYFGAKNLKRGALFIYAVFILLSVAFRVYLAYVYPTWLMILLTVISVLLELYVFKQTVKLLKMIPQLTAQDQQWLQQTSDMFI